ncbi:hypothetical protein K458DRAFT_305401 [Lentithecium fluviatile CBS 122367]|uniref:YTH domain-containing protein n=1 Tax=Lentithecium fluviatile CBS 122367 TaxID=1168545 RepID=A0A6G1IZ80_9PLEO|nr:hypothetical protein K458DRAFT_305401 [Lentithecium fluviatile CBS 122367]
MGDMPHGSGPQALGITATGLAQDEHQGTPNPTLNLKSPSNNTPFYSQLSAIPQTQPRPDLRSPAHPQSPHYPTQDHGASSMNMGVMAGALPDFASVNVAQGNPAMLQHDQRQLSGASTSALVYQLQQNLQIPGPTSGSLPSHYGAGFNASQFQQNFAPQQGSQHPNYAQFPTGHQRVAGPGPMQTPYQSFPQHSQFLYYPGPYGPQAQYSQGFPGQNNQGQAVYGRRQSVEMPQQEGGFTINRMVSSSMQDPGAVGPMFGGPFVQAPGYQHPGPASSIPRGPPRKPKQSGHALWVGNLPPGTTVVALKDHFSRDATKDIESLFLISKSNCAFVNYRTEASCTAAMHRFHDSRFNGVRLVCRLRRSSAPASGIPTGPSAMVGSQTASGSPPRSPEVDVEGAQVEGEAAVGKSSEEVREASTSSEKYFIVKSLTLQDLELSVRNGIWATQSHNEEALNKAFETAENVYLIFSANKSGEYFGYARMASRILEDATQLMGSAPKPEPNIDATDVPKSIPTPATEFAPKGRIIDDSARGTIFWEAELTESESEEEQGEKEDPTPQQQQVDVQGGEASGVAQSWGKPFKIEWISTNRLPFYRTRGLRNPWNANREVKIARDGTELEPSVGERLLQMFHRLGPSSSAAAPMMQPQMRQY